MVNQIRSAEFSDQFFLAVVMTSKGSNIRNAVQAAQMAGRMRQFMKCC